MGEPNIWFLVEKHLKVDVLGIPPPPFYGFWSMLVCRNSDRRNRTWTYTWVHRGIGLIVIDPESTIAMVPNQFLRMTPRRLGEVWGDLAADELCGGHYDKEKKIWSLPRGILALLKTMFWRIFPQFRSRPFKNLEVFAKKSLKVPSKSVSNSATPAPHFSEAWWNDWIHQGIPSYRRKLVHLLGDELLRPVWGQWWADDFPWLFGEKNSCGATAIWGASPGHQMGFWPTFLSSVFLKQCWTNPPQRNRKWVVISIHQKPWNREWGTSDLKEPAVVITNQSGWCVESKYKPSPHSFRGNEVYCWLN